MMKSILFVAAAIIFFLVGFAFYLKRKRLQKNGIRVQGVIKELIGSGDSIYPVIEFKTILGESIIMKYNVSKSPGAKVGDRVEMLYNPNNPNSFIIDGKAEKWLPVIFMGFSIVVLIIYFIFFANKE
jgi:Protein of unknown function (DUF3592)